MSEAKHQGYTDYHEGKDITDNPYPYRSDAAMAWKEGWEDAQEDAYNEGS